MDRSLWPSEVLWQCYELSRRSNRDFSTSKLNFVIRNCLINESTRIAIWQAARLSTSTAEGPNGFRVYTRNDDGFLAILGSPNGASTLRLLIDHKASIKLKLIGSGHKYANPYLGMRRRRSSDIAHTLNIKQAFEYFMKSVLFDSIW